MTQTITEEMGVHKDWYAEARKMTPETLPAFTRLGALVRRLRQGDLVDLAYRPPAKECRRP